MLRHELVDRGHAEKRIDALRGITDQLQRPSGIEGAHDQNRAAGMQHRVGVAIEPAGVEQRQHGQQHRGGRDVGRAAEIDTVPERHAVGDDGTLGLARGARGVHDRGDVIERDVFEARERLCRCDRGLVGAAWAERERGFDIAELGDGKRGLGEIGVVNHELRRGVADDELQLGNGEAGIQRQEYRAQPAAGELHFQRIGGVVRQHRDAVAARYPEPIAQMRGKARNPRIELRVAEAAFAEEIDHGHLVRCPAAEMRDPVIVPNWQNSLRVLKRPLPRGPFYGAVRLHHAQLRMDWLAGLLCSGSHRQVEQYRGAVLRRVAARGIPRRTE